ncbi:MAG: epoxyqueuosine reductase QueH [Thermaerobacter sp.]|nr:epoxyqueuosine reductase QueH [Thermaerobacter sp.]
MRILLHACCGPCAAGPLTALGEEGHGVDLLFYNPNIHPYREYLRRLDALEEVARRLGAVLWAGETYDLEGWLAQAVRTQERGRSRCEMCFRIRLEETARVAAAGAFDAFTTTLLGSPHQDQAVLRRVGEAAGRRFGANFWGRSFRPQFAAGRTLARRWGLYRQGYCGCIYSEAERYRGKPRKRAASSELV